jgi:hypothetical protein
MASIQGVEEFSDIHLQDIAAPTVHQLGSERLQRLMCRSSGPETVRTVQKVLLIDWLQQHDDRPLKDLILQGGNSDRASLGSRAAFRNMHTSHRRRAVRAGFRAVEQALQVSLQILFVVSRGHSVYAHRSILAGASIRFLQPVDVHQVGQRGERHLRRLLRQRCYPFLFRGHVCRISMHSSCFSKTVP